VRLPQILVPLRHRDFRLLWTGQTVSSFGNNVNKVALPFQLLVLGASPWQLGIAVAINIGTIVALVLVGGAIADRVPRRRLILASDLVGGITVSAVAVLSATAQLRIEHLYAAAVSLGVASAFLDPAYNAIVADLVPPDVLRAGNALRLLGRSVARIAGPTVGGLAFALAGPSLAFGFDALTFFFSFATLLLAHPPRRGPMPTASIVRDIRDGFGYVFSVRWLWTTTIYFMIVNIAYAGQTGVMTPLLVRDELRGDAAVYGVISAAYGVGTIVASIVVAQLAAHRPGLVLYGFELLAAVSVLGMGLFPNLAAVVVLMAVCGAALASSTVIWQALIQRNVPERMLGRVSSIDLLGNSLINPVAPIAAAAFVTAIGPASTFVAAGGYALVLAAIGVIVTPLRHLREGTPPAQASDIATSRP